MEISQNFVAFSEYMNFDFQKYCDVHRMPQRIRNYDCDKKSVVALFEVFLINFLVSQMAKQANCQYLKAEILIVIEYKQELNGEMKQLISNMKNHNSKIQKSII